MQLTHLRHLGRAAIPAPLFSLIFSLLMVLAYNAPVWRYIWHKTYDGSPASIIFIVSLGLFMIATLCMLMALCQLFKLGKPVAIAVILSASAILYFMNTYSIAIDSDMIQNAFETDSHEASDLLSPALFYYLFGLGVVPATIIWKIPIRPASWPRHILQNLLTAILALLLITTLVATSYKSYAAFFRNHREFRNLVIPTSYLYYTFRYLQSRYDATPDEVATLASDAHQQPALERQSRRQVTIMVVGETGRATNWSLDGYHRDTNPALARETDLINFPQASSCGTSTAVSVPCMFSHLNQKDFSNEKAAEQENVLDVIQRAGINVLWRDNQSGCKGVCTRVPSQLQPLKNFRSPDWCDKTHCYDPAMLTGLEDYIDAQKGDVLIVLHQMGSHGPAYYKRYPAQFAQYKPECTESDLPRCSRDSIVNAYDNSMLYTDFTVDQVIRFLKDHQQKYNSAMLYMADHGESLGENNIYLHGMPYFMAPKEQTHVPFVAWFSPGYQQDYSLDLGCVRQRAKQPVSQDNLFDTLLGVTHVATRVYRPQQDLISPCQNREVTL